MVKAWDVWAKNCSFWNDLFYFTFWQDLSEQLDDEEENSAEMQEARKKMEAEISDLKQDVEDLETALKKVPL